MIKPFYATLCLFIIIPAIANPILHFGDIYSVEMLPYKLSSPAIVTSTSNGAIYYASLSIDDCSPIKLKYAGQIYSVCDDCTKFTPVEYLASTGEGEYIDTGVFISPDNINKVKIEVEFSSTYNDGWNIPVGIGYPSPKPYCFVSVGYKQIVFGYNGDIYTEIPISLEQAGSFHKYSIDYSVGEIRIDDELVYNFDLMQFSDTNAQSLYMFTWNTNGSKLSYQYHPLKIKWARISIDGKLVRDYIPVLDSQNVPAMYDLVSQQFFYNIGSGQFEYKN